jgi:fucose 4-O-acetylase-like acetyltransferase
MNKNQPKLRLDYLDYAKALGILLIVFEHVSQYFSAFKAINPYFNFRVSIFFVVSGGLFLFTNSKDLVFKEYWNKKIKSLIVPYIVFSLINSALKFAVLFAKGKITNAIIVSEMKELLITGNGTVWFLFTLFLIEVAFYFIYKIKSDVYVILIGIIAAIIPFLIGQTYNSFLIVILRALLGLGYYIFGYYLFKNLKKYDNIPKYIGITCVAIGAFLSRFAGAESYFGGVYTNVFVTVPSILLGICGWVFIFKNIKAKSQLLSYTGKNSLIIMLTHPILLLFFTYPLSGLFSRIGFNMQIGLGLLLFVFIMLLEIPCIFVLNKFLPFMIGKSSKGKIKAINVVQ